MSSDAPDAVFGKDNGLISPGEGSARTKKVDNRAGDRGSQGRLLELSGEMWRNFLIETVFTTDVVSPASAIFNEVARTAMHAAKLFLFILLVASPACCATLMVGPGQQYAFPCQAFAAAQSGDVVLIDANGNGGYNGDTCSFRVDNLTIRGINGRAHIDATGVTIPNQKAIWVVGGTNTRIENIELSGASVPNGAGGNGAGIRFEGKNLTLRNCYLHDNQNGILTNINDIGDLLFEYSEFAFNGGGDAGHTHNIYVNYADSLTMRFCYSHDAKGGGHLVKSRAMVNHILYNRLTDEAGNVSYELDLPSGGTSYIVGNLIEQDAASPNWTIIAYDEEATNPKKPPNPTQDLYVVNNTIVNDNPQGLFIHLDPYVTVPAIIQNNIFYGPGTVSDQGNAVHPSNVRSQNATDFVNEAGYDYHLTAGAPEIGAGTSPPNSASGDFNLAPVFQYVHSSGGCSESRPNASSLDAGAYQFNGTPGQTPGPMRCPNHLDFLANVTNGASYVSDFVAPGSFFTLWGSGFASTGMGAPTDQTLPMMLNGVSLQINGVPAPLAYAGPSQINAQLPFETQPGVAVAVVNVGGTNVAGGYVRVLPTAPGLFYSPTTGQAAVLNQDSSPNTPQNPEAAGNTLQAFLTGQGADVDNPVPDGQPAPISPLSPVSKNVTYSASINGQDATVSFLGLAPTWVGLLQANVQIPQGLTTGNYPLVITIGKRSSNPATISVK